eukprot:COSAG05_NODE_22537_length_264_cov_0.624242_1_plen_78_part_01
MPLCVDLGGRRIIKKSVVGGWGGWGRGWVRRGGWGGGGGGGNGGVGGGEGGGDGGEYLMSLSPTQLILYAADNLGICA